MLIVYSLSDILLCSYVVYVAATAVYSVNNTSHSLPAAVNYISLPLIVFICDGVIIKLLEQHLFTIVDNIVSGNISICINSNHMICITTIISN